MLCDNSQVTSIAATLFIYRTKKGKKKKKCLHWLNNSFIQGLTDKNVIPKKKSDKNILTRDKSKSDERI